MLTEDEKIELHFNEALRKVNVAKVIERVMDNMKPFAITIETELDSWTERNPALSAEMYPVIKDTVKAIRMYWTKKLLKTCEIEEWKCVRDKALGYNDTTHWIILE